MNLTDEQCDEQDRRELLRDVADRAAARWKEAVAEQAEAYRLAGDRHELELWADLTTGVAIDAGRALVRAILAFSPEYKARSYRSEKRRWAPRGVRIGRKLYLAIPAPDRDEGLDGIPEDLDGPDLMRLVAVDVAAIVDLDRDGHLEF